MPDIPFNRQTFSRTGFPVLCMLVLFSLVSSPQLSDYGRAFAESKDIDLNACIKIALENNPNIQASEEDRKIDTANYKIAKANRGLMIDGQAKTVERLSSDSSSDSNVRIPGKDTNIGLFAGLYGYYNLYDAKKEKKEKASKVQMAVSKIDSEKIRSTVVLNVKKAYFQYLLALDTRELRKKLLDKSKTKQDLAQKLYNNGLQPIIDVSRANVALAQSSLNYERAQNDERSLKTELCTFMGVRETEEFSVIPVDRHNVPDLKYNEEELNKLALLYNPDLRSIDQKKRMGKLNIEIQKAERLPTVQLTFGLGYENDVLYFYNSTDGSIGDNFKSSNWGPVFTTTFIASVPVYYGGAIEAAIDKSMSDYNKLIYQERDLLVTVKNRINSNYEQLGELKKQLRTAQLIIENSEKYALLAQRRYENGEGSLMELQNSEEEVLNAELGYLSSLYQYYLTLATISNTLGVEEEELCSK
jgi:outer membrane protein TolC